MSVRKRGKQFEVRWTEGGRKLSRSFLRAEDARAFDFDIKRRKQLGALAPGIIQSRQTLAEFVEEEWWPRYAIPNLAPDRPRYLEVWGGTCCRASATTSSARSRRWLVEDFREQMTSSEGRRADAAQSDDAAPGHPPARGRARADPGESSAARRQAQAEADAPSATAPAADGRADPREHAPAADQDGSGGGGRQAAARSRTAAAPGATCGTARCTCSRRRPGGRATSTWSPPGPGPRRVADGLWPSA